MRRVDLTVLDADDPPVSIVETTCVEDIAIQALPSVRFGRSAQLNADAALS